MTSRPCSSRATAPVGSRDVAASVAVSRPRHCNQTWARTPSNVRGPSASHRTGCGLARQLRVLPRPQNASSRGPRAFPAAKKGRAGLFRNYYEFLVPKRCYPQKCPRPPMRAHGTVEYSPKRVLLAKPGLHMCRVGIHRRQACRSARRSEGKRAFTPTYIHTSTTDES